MARAPDAIAGGGPGARIVSISTALFDGYGMDLAIDEIARSGAAFVEPAYIKGYVDFGEDDFASAPAKRLRQSIEQAGLSVHAISAHMNLALPDARAMLARRVAFAETIGAKVLITNAGPADHAEAIRTVIDASLGALEAWGGMLAIENPGHGAGDLVGSARQGKALIDAVGAPHLRLNHDAGNVFTYSREALQPAEDFTHAAQAIGHAHLKDVRRSHGGWEFCALGAGNVDLAAYLAAIPHDLPLSLELPLRLSRPGYGDPVRSMDPLALGDLRAALAQSLDFVRQHTRTSHSDG